MEVQSTEPDVDETLTRLVAERGAWLVQCAFLLTRDREQSLDLAQDTLARAWSARDRVAGAEHPDRYLLRVMLNLHRSGFRRRRLQVVDLADADHLSTPDTTGAVDDHDEVAAAMATLVPRQRAVLVLRYWADLDDPAIAEVLGCRRSTVRSLAARAMTNVRRNLEEEQG